MSDKANENVDTFLDTVRKAYEMPTLPMVLAAFHKTVMAYAVASGTVGSPARREVFKALGAAFEGMALGFFEDAKDGEVSNGVSVAEDDVGSAPSSNNGSDTN